MDKNAPDYIRPMQESPQVKVLRDLVRRNHELENLLREAADDIESSVLADYPDHSLSTSQERRFKRDMDLPCRIRAALPDGESAKG